MEPEKPDWCTTDCWKQKFLPESFFQSKRYLFKILTNPTKTLSHRDPGGNKKKNGSHFGITRKEELRKWFIQKGEQNGYHVLDEPELEIAPPVFYKLNRKNDAGVLVGVEFKGGLEVISIEKFASAVRKGIGRARGFGFGMFVIKPIL
jgi:CRISPR system Cascade subunit CasE